MTIRQGLACVHSKAPSRARATAETSRCWWPESRVSRAWAASSVAHLLRNSPPKTITLSPPRTSSPGWRRDTVSAFCSARLCATVSAGAPLSCAIKASSSRSAGSAMKDTPAAVSSALRLWLPDASTNAISGQSFLALGHHVDDRRGRFLDGAAGNIDHRPILVFEQLPRGGNLGPHRIQFHIRAVARFAHAGEPIASHLYQ